MYATCSGEFVEILILKIVEIITQSQQKVSSLLKRRISPTLTSAEVVSYHFPSMRHLTFVPLVFLSDPFLTQSSTPSLIMEIAKTAARGTNI